MSEDTQLDNKQIYFVESVALPYSEKNEPLWLELSTRLEQLKKYITDFKEYLTDEDQDFIALTKKCSNVLISCKEAKKQTNELLTSYKDFVDNFDSIHTPSSSDTAATSGILETSERQGNKLFLHDFINNLDNIIKEIVDFSKYFESSSSHVTNNELGQRLNISADKIGEFCKKATLILEAVKDIHKLVKIIPKAKDNFDSLSQVKFKRGVTNVENGIKSLSEKQENILTKQKTIKDDLKDLLKSSNQDEDSLEDFNEKIQKLKLSIDEAKQKHKIIDQNFTKIKAIHSDLDDGFEQWQKDVEKCSYEINANAFIDQDSKEVWDVITRYLKKQIQKIIDKKKNYEEIINEFEEKG